jgi:hypothetical protein
MANITFPTSPTTGQVYTYNSKTWVWTGTVWQASTIQAGPDVMHPFLLKV